MGKGNGDNPEVVYGDKAFAGGNRMPNACLLAVIRCIRKCRHGHALILLPSVLIKDQSIGIDGDSGVHRFYVNDHFSGLGASGAHLVSGTASFTQEQRRRDEHQIRRARTDRHRSCRNDGRGGRRIPTNIHRKRIHRRGTSSAFD